MTVGSAQTIAVKPLEWQAVVTNGEETHLAFTIVGCYAVWEKAGIGYVIVPSVDDPSTYPRMPATDLQKVGTSVAEAKAFAQSNFVARIRSALV